MGNEAEEKSKGGMKFGIDLGTTYSSIGWYDADRHQVQLAQLDSAQGSSLLPSDIFVESTDNVVIGVAAAHAGLERPERLFRWFKRDMGNPPDSTHVIDGKQWTPVECSTKILETLKKEGETIFGTEVKDVVITYPAWFLPNQKDLTREAAVAAGLNVIRMTEEPQAAALAYVVDEVIRRAEEASEKVGDLSSLLPQIIEKLAGGDSAVLVYDLGGGTFDVAMVQAEGKPAPDGSTELHFKTLHNDGNITLGGKDWDLAIKNIVVQIDQQENGHNPLDDPQAGRLDDECEQRKRDLSRLTSVKILCPSLHQIEVTRDRVKEATADLLLKTREVTESVINEAIQKHGIKKENITVILSGGMTRWPPVVEMLTDVMDGKKPVKHQNVDFIVTYGAAYLAQLTGVVSEVRERESSETQPSTEMEQPRQTITSVKDESIGISLPTEGWSEGLYPAIGIEVVDKSDPMYEIDPSKARTRVSRIIPSDPKVGDSHKDRYSTVYDKQKEVDIVLYFLRDREGYKDNETDVKAWKKYKTFKLTNLPPAPAGYPVDVRLQYREGGVIDGAAWDESGQEVRIEGKTIEG